MVRRKLVILVGKLGKAEIRPWVGLAAVDQGDQIGGQG
jgi:hypothetical protein